MEIWEDCFGLTQELCYLGGLVNESDFAAWVTSHIALATKPDFVIPMPGLGADKCLVIYK